MSLSFLLEECILEASLRTFWNLYYHSFGAIFAANPVEVFNIRGIHLNFQFFKDFQNSAFQSVIITCFGNTGQFQALTSGVLTIAPSLTL